MTLDDSGTSKSPSRPGTVLVVDDEPDVAELFASMLADKYTVRIATTGEEALETMSDQVGVVLMDRRMPGISGDELLTIIRDEGYDCMVAMVSAIDPDLDLLDLPFDQYITKPVYKSEILNVVDELFARSQLNDDLQELYRVISKLVTLESRYTEEELSGSAEYRALNERKEALLSASDDRIAQVIDDGGSDFTFKDLNSFGELS